MSFRSFLFLTSIAVLCLCAIAPPSHAVGKTETAAPRNATAPLARDITRYTSHLAHPPADIETFSLRIDSAFTPSEREQILRAIDQWNLALNGHIRLELEGEEGKPKDHDIGMVPDAQQRATWIVAKVTGRRGSAPERGPSTHALAVTQALAGVGGTILVFADRIGSRDLSGIMMHEFGHMLGLGHDPKGRLMTPRYAGSNQLCIDPGTVQAVAALKHLPVVELNWCGALAPSAPTTPRVAAAAKIAR